MTAYLQFHCHSNAGQRVVEASIHTLVIAGWAGRDEKALRHHIEELAAIGVPRPSSVPVFYRGSASLLTQAESLDVLGPDSSGEVEPVIVALEDGLWLGVGSDHTDRKAETFGIALSKQMCGKPISRDLWRLDEVIARWDTLEMRSHATIGGQSMLYQEGKLSGLRTPADLIGKWTNGGALQPGTVMFGGTLGAIGGIRPADHFAMEIADPATGKILRHGYAIQALPVIA
ncbi:MAG: DUF2848 domain-containing protein [Beijerinckiaceae bacterium]